MGTVTAQALGLGPAATRSSHQQNCDAARRLSPASRSGASLGPIAAVQVCPTPAGVRRGLPERARTFGSRHSHCRLPRLWRPTFTQSVAQFLNGARGRCQIVRATTGEMCQSRVRADLAKAAGVSRGRGLAGGADATRTPLADSQGQCRPFPQNTARRDIDGRADLDRLSALHNHEP